MEINYNRFSPMKIKFVKQIIFLCLTTIININCNQNSNFRNQLCENELEDLAIVKSLYLSDFYNYEGVGPSTTCYDIEIKNRNVINTFLLDSLKFIVYEVRVQNKVECNAIVYYGKAGKIGYLLSDNYNYPKIIVGNLREYNDNEYRYDMLRLLPCMINSIQYLCNNEPFFLNSDSTIVKKTERVKAYLSCLYDSTQLGSVITKENYYFQKKKFNLFSFESESEKEDILRLENEFYEQIKSNLKNVVFVRVKNQILRFLIYEGYKGKTELTILWIKSRVKPFPSY
jgi:hypothetical protein